MADIDTNVSNYSLSELLTIVGIDDENINEEQIMKNTNALINKFKGKNLSLSNFFSNVQIELLQYAQGLEDNDINGNNDINGTSDINYDNNNNNKIIVEGFGSMSKEALYPAGDKQISDWYQNQYIEQNDTNQKNKIRNYSSSQGRRYFNRKFK